MEDLQVLKDKAISGSLWSMLERFSLQIVQLIVGVLLARLLEPKDYGLIAITLIFVSISAALTDGGFEKTLILKKEISSLEITTIFYINIVIGALINLLLVITAPIIANFFHEPGITPVLRLISCGITINAFGQVQSILLRKEMKFKKLSFGQVVASLIGGIVGIVLAFNNMGVWSLAFSILVTQVILSGVYWIDSSWYPKKEFSLAVIKPMRSFGANVLFTSLLLFIIQQFNTFIVGRYFTKTDLGLFNRGNRFPDMIVNTIEGVVQKTSFPLFSKLQGNETLTRKAVEKSIKVVAFISFPLLTIMFINAKNITITLFTEKWSGSIIFLQLFCVARFLQPFLGIFKEVILAKGKALELVKMTVVTSIVEIASIMIVIRFGLIYIVIATFFSMLVQYFLYSIYVFKKIEVRWINHLAWLSPYFLISLIIAIASLLINHLIISTELLRSLKLIISLASGLTVFILCIFMGKVKEREYLTSLYKIFKTKAFKMLAIPGLIVKKS